MVDKLFFLKYSLSSIDFQNSHWDKTDKLWSAMWKKIGALSQQTIKFLESVYQLEAIFSY